MKLDLNYHERICIFDKNGMYHSKSLTQRIAKINGYQLVRMAIRLLENKTPQCFLNHPTFEFKYAKYLYQKTKSTEISKVIKKLNNIMLMYSSQTIFIHICSI